MRTQNRDRKSGKMSERIRRAVGAAAVISSLLLCFVPAAGNINVHESSYRSVGRSQWHLTDIPAEKKGGLRINGANADELASLPGIGEKIAQLIIAEREKNGPFYYPEDMESVKGIGPQTLQKYRTLIDMTLAESGE